MTRVELPWPDRRLGANEMRRSHWAKKMRLVKGARTAAAWNAVQQGVRRMDALKIKAAITLYPPDRRPRDYPNWQYACKAAIDGVADVIGVDDKHWKITWADGEPRPPQGAVVMELEAA